MKRKNRSIVVFFAVGIILGGVASSYAQDPGSGTVPGRDPAASSAVPPDSASTLVWFGLIGGMLTDALRVLAWAKTPPDQRPNFPGRDIAFWVSLLVGAGLGIVAVLALTPTHRMQAIAVGFSAPELLTRGVAAAVGPQQPRVSTAISDIPARLVRWWAS